jgi:hypothetical protein
MVSAPLYIDRGQVHAGQGLIRFFEQMMSNVGGDVPIKIVDRISGKSQKDRVDSPAVDRGRIEKHLSQL